ncbi:hypothetical protein M8C21_029001 [Ambrosia artemisiifolia]|uniref:Uncharacterized protein n=1 Tax=Ambrosia artemisiifolia TaxID=4212 RepID=A0AAD5GQK9_AMBAR|nr:hypothetical protein M8C21_029001 [Ambrosia artemisiifolia]
MVYVSKSILCEYQIIYLWVAEDGMKMQSFCSQQWDAGFAIQALLATDLSEEIGSTLKIILLVTLGAYTGISLKCCLLFSTMPLEIFGEEMQPGQLYDDVNIILSLQSKSGGLVAWEPPGSSDWLETPLMIAAMHRLLEVGANEHAYTMLLIMATLLSTNCSLLCLKLAHCDFVVCLFPFLLNIQSLTCNSIFSQIKPLVFVISFDHPYSCLIGLSYLMIFIIVGESFKCHYMVLNCFWNYGCSSVITLF